MRREKVELMITGNIAKELGVSDAGTKKIISFPISGECAG